MKVLDKFLYYFLILILSLENIDIIFPMIEILKKYMFHLI